MFPRLITQYSGDGSNSMDEFWCFVLYYSYHKVPSVHMHAIWRRPCGDSINNTGTFEEVTRIHVTYHDDVFK